MGRVPDRGAGAEADAVGLPRGQVVSDGAEVFARGAAAACERGQVVCICGQRPPSRSSKAGGGQGRQHASGASSSSSSAPATSPWLLVEPGRTTPGSRTSENGMDSLEHARRAVVLAASNIEVGLDLDEVHEC